LSCSRRVRDPSPHFTCSRQVRDPSPHLTCSRRVYDPPPLPPVADRREHSPAARDGCVTRRPSRRSRTGGSIPQLLTTGASPVAPPAGRGPAGAFASCSRRVRHPSPLPPVADRREHSPAARHGCVTRRPSRRSRTSGSIRQLLATGASPVAPAAGRGPAGAFASCSRRVRHPSPLPPVADQREHSPAAHHGCVTRRPSRRSRTSGSTLEPLAPGPLTIIRVIAAHAAVERRIQQH
jgi:hypothetical protein